MPPTVLTRLECTSTSRSGERRRSADRSRAGTASLVLLLLACSHSEHGPAATSAAPKASAAVGVASAAPAASSSAAPQPATQVPADRDLPTKATAPEPTGPRVYAKSRFVWIREFPTTELQWIGYLWTGGSVALRSDKVFYGPGCETWYAIEPRGFVCVDGKRATLDPNDPVLRALTPHAPDLDTAWPHVYGESRGLPRYTQLPKLGESPAVLQPASAAAEAPIPAAALRRLDRDPFGLVTLPQTVYEGRTRLLPLSTVAYSSELTRDDGTYLLAADMTWVPKDRVTPYERVTFQGVELGKDAKLPLAFFRGSDRPQYVRASDGSFSPNGKSYTRLSHVALSGESVRVDDEVYLGVAGSSVFIKKSEAVVPEPRTVTPWGTKVGSSDRSGLPEGRATWMEASVWGGWLIAYEGNTPVYVTLISPGRGGTPVPGKDPLETASTPTGSFPISGKFATATMEAPGEYIHSDVPWTQNFSGPHALHGAYWHNDWGKLKSAGCVNVSPIDGRWLYEFTEPAVPPGWHGVRWVPSKGPATTFVVHR